MNENIYFKLLKYINIIFIQKILIISVLIKLIIIIIKSLIYNTLI